MLEENPTTTPPAESPEDLSQVVFREKMTRRAQTRARRRTQVRVILGVLGAVFLILFYLGLSSIFGRGGSDTLTQQGSVLQGASSGQLVPSALDEPVTLSVTSTPSGATVYLDDNPIGITPFTSDTLKPGAWTLSVQKLPFARFDSVLFLTEGMSLHLSLSTAQSVAVARVPDEAEPKATPSAIMVVQEAEPAVSEEPTSVAAEPAAPPPKGVPAASTAQDSQALIQHEQPSAELLKEAETASADSLAAQAQRDQQQYRLLSEQGDALFRQGDYEAALAKYEATLDYKPGDVYALEKIAESKRALEPVRIPQERPEAIDVSTASNTPPPSVGQRETTPPKRAYRTRRSGSGRRVKIIDIHGKRALEAGEVENFRVATAPGTTPPTEFHWESGEGVFARGRSINLQFSKAGAYTITIKAYNSYGTDTDTVMVTVKEPTAKQLDSKR